MSYHENKSGKSKEVSFKFTLQLKLNAGKNPPQQFSPQFLRACTKLSRDQFF